MLKFIAPVAVVATLLAPTTQASEQNVNPWQHCGIGAMVFDNNGAAAAISNIIWDLGTTAVSSKISSVENCAGAKAKTAMFIKQSYNNIIEETAQGQGEHLNAMLDLLEVDQASRQDVLTNVRSDMATVVSNANYANTTPAQKAEMYYNTLVARAL
ncbi:DUF3015 family protein [Psychrobium sp. 1_MG-2023]|uniref:DUF3015 family protein n=1 Tax=Psychrobium sp. 1_MG-2023 TaxID=3062624 RepID=UPI000C33CA92|nr:DUF3015 family protein [Psychrobium sp. 1_MG-2023]MDP2561639.1 DUF3015 family protein [Psychrobium sp. 1_MG-2023]PKF55656.1 DUF3015 domain-containing protein [Alteromonadales bacterium alter-6D02]